MFIATSASAEFTGLNITGGSAAGAMEKGGAAFVAGMSSFVDCNIYLNSADYVPCSFELIKPHAIQTHACRFRAEDSTLPAPPNVV